MYTHVYLEKILMKRTIDMKVITTMRSMSQIHQEHVLVWASRRSLSSFNLLMLLSASTVLSVIICGEYKVNELKHVIICGEHIIIFVEYKF